MILDFGDDSSAPFVCEALEALVKRLSRENPREKTTFGVVYTLWARGRGTGPSIGRAIEDAKIRGQMEAKLVVQWQDLIDQTVLSQISPQTSDELILYRICEVVRGTECLSEETKLAMERAEYRCCRYDWATEPFLLGFMHEEIKKRHRIDVVEKLYKEVASVEADTMTCSPRFFLFLSFIIPLLNDLLTDINETDWRKTSYSDFASIAVNFAWPVLEMLGSVLCCDQLLRYVFP